MILHFISLTIFFFTVRSGFVLYQATFLRKVSQMFKLTNLNNTFCCDWALNSFIVINMWNFGLKEINNEQGQLDWNAKSVF